VRQAGGDPHPAGDKAFFHGIFAASDGTMSGGW